MRSWLRWSVMERLQTRPINVHSLKEAARYVRHTQVFFRGLVWIKLPYMPGYDANAKRLDLSPVCVGTSVCNDPEVVLSCWPAFVAQAVAWRCLPLDDVDVPWEIHEIVDETAYQVALSTFKVERYN